MIVDTEPCPCCEMSPGPGRYVFGPTAIRPDVASILSHRAEALTTELVAGGVTNDLWFVCERCGARWPVDQRARRVEPPSMKREGS